MVTIKNDHDVTDDNYYSKEMGLKYLSVHALMTYMKDPSLFWLKAHGYLINTSSDSANAGRLFHAFMNDEKDYKQEVMALGKTPFSVGRKKVDEDEIIATVLTDPYVMKPKAPYESVWSFITENWEKRHAIWNDDEYIKELILVGEIGGAPFKGRLDKLKVVGNKAYIYDYKTIALKEYYGFWYQEDIDGDVKRYDKSFIHDYNYDLQMTAYAELVKQNFPDVKDVYITFGMLIKKGKHEFTEYPTSFVETETVNVRDLSTKRFNGETPLSVLMNQSKYAHDLLQMNQQDMLDTYGSSLMTEMVTNSGQKLKFEDFKLK